MYVAPVRLCDMVSRIVPIWLRDRPGFNTGYRVLYGVGKLFDTVIEQAVEGVQAAWPGWGTDTALPAIGRSRRIMQGQAETAAHYAVRLQKWLETHADGRTTQLAVQVHEYLANNPRVRVFERTSGRCTTVDVDGTITKSAATAWDWDSVSNPERSGYWSDLWVVIYPTQYALRPGTMGGLAGGDDGYGLGLMIPHADVQVLDGIVREWKSAHSNIRAVIWATDATLFDPATPASMPDGQWGQWSIQIAGASQPSHRNTSSCRYWEP